MSSECAPSSAPRTPPEEWRGEWQQRMHRVAPEQLKLDNVRAKAYWSSPELAHQSRLLNTFGRASVLILDTILVFITEVVLNLLLAAIALFVIAINSGYLAHGSTVNNALSHASITMQDWLTSPVGIACGAVATQIAIVLVLYLRVVRRGILSWRGLGFGPALRREPVKALIFGLGLGLVAFVVGELVLNIMQAMGLDVQGQENSFQSVKHASLAEIVPFFITTVFTAPLAEEAFFRAYALRALTVRYGLPAGLTLSSALFALLHLGGGVGWVVVPLFVVGLLLGWGYARTGNLITNITAHAVNNVIGVILLYGSR